MQTSPASTLLTLIYFYDKLSVRGGWGADSLGRCSVVAQCRSPSLVHSLLSSSCLRYWWQHWQSQLYTTEATVRVQLSVQRDVLLGGTQNARASRGRVPRAIPLHTSVVLLARLNLCWAKHFRMHPEDAVF
jgi:hypothetical protein